MVGTVKRLGQLVTAAHIILLPFNVAHASSEKQTFEPLYVRQCSNGSGRLKSDDLQALLAESSLAETQVREGLLAVMRQTDNRCRKSLENWLTEIKDKPMDHRTNTGRLAAVTLGVLLDLPVAKQWIESEAASGGGLEWLATLRQWDEKAYSELLKKWVMSGGEQIRRARGLVKLTPDTYGKNQIEDLSSAQSVQMLSPLVFDLFLKSLAQRPPTTDELAALNVIFVNLNAGARELYARSFVPVLRRNAVVWMQVFRTESAWTQFQLLDLMGRVGGAEMVRELMWISQNHADVRMKSRASQALDDAIKSR